MGLYGNQWNFKMEKDQKGKIYIDILFIFCAQTHGIFLFKKFNWADKCNMWQYYVLLMFSSETLDDILKWGSLKTLHFVCSVLFSVWEFIDKRISIYLSKPSTYFSSENRKCRNHRRY